MGEIDWDALLEQESMDEFQGGQWEDLPPNVWGIGEVETNPDLDWAKPTVRKTSGDKPFYIFQVMLRTTGGADGVEQAKHKSRAQKVEAFIHPSEKEKNPGILSGKMKGLLCGLLVPGKGGPEPKDKDAKAARSEERIKAVYAALNATAKKNNLSPDQYGGDMARFLAACAVFEMRDRTKSRSLIFKTMLETGSDGKDRIKTSSFCDDTPANRGDKGIVMFEVDDEVIPF